jgi:multiple antibiotic resistance protein
MVILKNFILSFIPLFVAVDALGNIPLFISLTEGLSATERFRVVRQSVLIAALLAIVFMFIGKIIFAVMGVSVCDFKIAGGILLFIISVNLLLGNGRKVNFLSGGSMDVGIFPLGTPLITGPAVLTTVLISRDNFGVIATSLALAVNMLLVHIIFMKSQAIIEKIGEAGVRAFSKIADILLAAIAVMLVRAGIQGILSGC